MVKCAVCASFFKGTSEYPAHCISHQLRTFYASFHIRGERLCHKCYLKWYNNIGRFGKNPQFCIVCHRGKRAGLQMITDEERKKWMCEAFNIHTSADMCFCKRCLLAGKRKTQNKSTSNGSPMSVEGKEIELLRGVIKYYW